MLPRRHSCGHWVRLHKDERRIDLHRRHRRGYTLGSRAVVVLDTDSDGEPPMGRYLSARLQSSSRRSLTVSKTRGI